MEHQSAARCHGYAVEPLLSVLVVVFRARAELPAVLESILDHKDATVELIVVDGGSDDGTVEYLRSLGDRIDYWLSEPDRGIYDAMNKAAAAARGTFLLHLNAGDRLLRVPADELRQANDDGIDVAAFRVSIDERQYFKPSAGFRLRITNTLHHQGTFYRKTTFLPYDLSYRIFADFDVNQRLALANARMRVYDTVVSSHQNDGVSNQNSERIEAEFFRVVEKNHGRMMLPAARFLRKWQGLRTMLGI